MGQAASRQEEFWEACGFGRPHLVKRFIEEGIDVNWKSYTHDCCPIHVASQGKPEIVSLLLAANCDVHVTDIQDNTALHHAAMKGHTDILVTLIKAGTNINAKNKNGWTALHNASYWCYPGTVKALIQQGCDVTICNKDNRSALHETARSKAADEDKLREITTLLITAGSDINAKGSDLGDVDFTSLMFASYHGHPEVASALIEAGCDVDAQGSNWWTSLHWAVDRGQDELVYLLLEAGADPTRKGLRAETAGDRAKTKDMKEVMRQAVSMFCELKALGHQKAPVSPSRVSREIKHLSNPERPTNQHSVELQSPNKHKSDLSCLIDKINEKTNKLKVVSRHDNQTSSDSSNTPQAIGSQTSSSDVQFTTVQSTPVQSTTVQSTPVQSTTVQSTPVQSTTVPNDSVPSEINSRVAKADSDVTSGDVTSGDAVVGDVAVTSANAIVGDVASDDAVVNDVTTGGDVVASANNRNTVVSDLAVTSADAVVSDVTIAGADVTGAVEGADGDGGDTHSIVTEDNARTQSSVHNRDSEVEQTQSSNPDNAVDK